MIDFDIERNHTPTVDQHRSRGNFRFGRSSRWRVTFLEVNEVIAAYEPGAPQSRCLFPTVSDQRRSRAQLADRPRQRERLELTGARVIVEKEYAHRVLSEPGRDSTNRFRSVALSHVVTSVSPSCTTTTNFSTPYITTRPPSTCTTLSVQSSMCTSPVVTLPNSSLSRTLPSALQVPMSSQPKSPRTTATFLLRSSTALSTEIGLGTAAKNSDASPSSSSDNAFLSSTACCFA